LEPDATTPPAIIADFVVIDATLAGTPCFNCVNGTTGGTFGLTQPVAYIATTFTSLQLVLYYQNISYMGSCKATFTIKNVSKTLLTVSKTFTKFAPNTVGFVSLGGKRPKTSGAASLAGSLKCGSNPATTATGSIYLQ
jgi:hypothetical protein